MTKTEFEVIVNNRIETVRNLLINKAAEYANDQDRLHNFNLGARVSGDIPAKVLDSYMLKHYCSYRDMLDKMEQGELIPKRVFEEKIGDIITYLFLQEAVMLDSGLIK